MGTDYSQPSDTEFKHLHDLLRYAIDEHAIVAITDPAGVITYINDKFCDISKYSREELIGQTHRIINSGHHPKSFFTEMWSTIAKGNTWRGEVCNRAKDGSVYWVDTTIVPFVDRSGKITQYIAIRADITSRKNTEHELSLHKYAIDEHAIVAITDPAGVITYINDKFCDISKYSREELIGQTHRIINSGHHPKSFFTEMWSTIAKGNTWRGEVCNRAKDGSVYWVDTTIVPFVDRSGKITQYIAIRADITSRKTIEHELRRANEGLEEFVYTASHDLKSPLLTIEGFSGHIPAYIKAGDYEKSLHCIERVSAAVSRMRSNIDDLLEMSKIGRVELIPVDIELESNIQSLIREFDTQIQASGARIVIEKDVPTVRCDLVRIRQLLTNMISNALKHGRPDKGPFVITIGAVAGIQSVKIFVSDNGPGIAGEYREKVFELFQRLETKVDGTGVGLNIVKRVAEVHGGRAWIEDTLGGGTTVCVEIPTQLFKAETHHTNRDGIRNAT